MAIAVNRSLKAKTKELVRLLGKQDTCKLAGISMSSLGRYLSGLRPTPPDVAERLTLLRHLTELLRGGYNEIGIPQWFFRPRHFLNGRRPADILSGKWDPHDPTVLEIMINAEWVQKTP